VTRWPWRKRLEEAEEALRVAEELRDRAEEQQHQAEAMTQRVDAVSSSLRKLHTDNHFGPLIDSILRGGSG
jgi:hypothetical protein